jgi:hypothetical protein
MLDQLLVRRNAEKDVFTDSYAPNQAITGHELTNPTGRNLTVLFPPWHGGGWFYERLIARLEGRGDAVLAYYFHDEILKPDAEQVLKSFRYIRDTVAAELKATTEAHSYEKVKLIAMSLGNPAMAIVTGKFKDFDSASLVVGASSLATSMWYGSRTQHVRAGIEQNNKAITLATLEDMWSELAPINHIDALEGKAVSLLVSKTDAIIPTRFQLKLVEGIQAAGIKPNVQQTELGHYAAVGKFCLFGAV